MTTTAPPILHAEGISLRYGATAALEDVGLCLRAGEIHALMGQNGAGKSSLIKVLTGVVTPDAGCTRLDGQPYAPRTPVQAQQLGVSTVYQEVNLCPNLSVAENIVAGRYPRRPRWQGGGINWARARDEARALLADLQLHIDVGRPLASFPVAVQQMVSIARAVAIRARVLILDEPTSSLDDDEVAQLFTVMRRLREQGLAVLFVTHFLDQVYAVSDRITVLRNGRRVGEWAASALPHGPLIEAMVGRAMDEGTRAPRPAGSEVSADPVLAARGLARRGAVAPTDIRIHRGEVVGLGGLLGSGRTELARLLFGLDLPDAGEVAWQGRSLTLRGPADALDAGLALCPEERKTEGIVAELTVRENIVLSLQARMGLRHSLPLARQRAIAEHFVRLLGIRTASIETPVGRLSGGNQQKVVLARWLATQPQLLILDEPTRGIDIAAKQDIMDEILRLARDGMSVLFISAELAELVRVADRIAVMRDRRKAGELSGGCGEQAVLDLIAGHA